MNEPRPAIGLSTNGSEKRFERRVPRLLRRGAERRRRGRVRQGGRFAACVRRRTSNSLTPDSCPSVHRTLTVPIADGDPGPLPPKVPVNCHPVLCQGGRGRTEQRVLDLKVRIGEPMKAGLAHARAVAADFGGVVPMAATCPGPVARGSGSSLATKWPSTSNSWRRAASSSQRTSPSRRRWRASLMRSATNSTWRLQIVEETAFDSPTRLASRTM